MTRHARMLGFAVLSLTCIAAIGCVQAQSVAPPQKERQEVQVALPVVQEVIDYEDFPGRTDAVDTITVRARVTGYLLNANFTEGSDVTRGGKEVGPAYLVAESFGAQSIGP